MKKKYKHVIEINNESDAKKYTEVLKKLDQLEKFIKKRQERKDKGDYGAPDSYQIKDINKYEKRYKEVDSDYEHVTKEYSKLGIPKIPIVEKKDTKFDEDISKSDIIKDGIVLMGDKHGVSILSKYLYKITPDPIGKEFREFENKTAEIKEKEEVINNIYDQIIEDKDVIAAHNKEWQDFELKQEKERKELWYLNIKDAVKSYDTEYGELWKFTEEGKNTYGAYFKAKEDLYKDDAKIWAEIQKEKEEYEKKCLQHSAEVQAQKRKAAEEEAKRQQELFEAEIQQRMAASEKMGEIQIQGIELLNTETSATLELKGAKDLLAQSNEKIAQQTNDSQTQQTKTIGGLQQHRAQINAIGKDIDYLGDQIKNPATATALDGLGSAFDIFSKKMRKNNDANTQNTEQNADAQKNALQGIAADVEMYSAAIVSLTGTLFAKQNEILKEEEEAAKEKYEALSKKYDEAVEKRKESDTELQSLEEQAKSARGGRLLVIQGQIDAEMAKNKQLSDQEKALQKDKDNAQKEIEKKQKQQKKNELKQQMITAIANTAEGIAKALGQWGFPLGIINAALIGAAGAIQVATISKQMSKLEDGGLLRGRRHRAGGMRIEGSNIEVEGGEYVVNRQSTGKNLGLLSYINGQRRELQADDLRSYFDRPFAPSALHAPFTAMMEQGGQVPQLPTTVDISNKDLLQSIQGIKIEPRVAVTDIHTVQDHMVQVDQWAGM